MALWQQKTEHAESITLPITKEQAAKLALGTIVRVSGIVYTARDAAHKLIIEALESGQQPPFPLENCAIYYVGASPAKKGEVIGSCGPTSSARMDSFAPTLIEAGCTVMIGKGKRGAKVLSSMQGRAVYLAAVGGAAVFYKQFITRCEPVAYPFLGCESVQRLTLKDMPLIVAADAHGGSIL